MKKYKFAIVGGGNLGSALANVLDSRGQEIIAVNFRAFEVWLTVAIFYLAMTLSISAVLRYYERKLMLGRRSAPAVVPPVPSDPQA